LKSVIFDNIAKKCLHLQISSKQSNKIRRILILNGDNPDNHASLKLDLERNGFIVDTFTDPLVALNNSARVQEEESSLV